MKLKQIYFVRHGQSEANVSLKAYKKYPDHAIPLTLLGQKQAESTGLFLKKHFGNLMDNLGHMPKIRLWQSPFLRTRQTADAIMKNCADIFYDRLEDPFLIEQQFGIFAHLSRAEQKKAYPEIQALIKRTITTSYGKFWCDFPLGESIAKVDVRCRLMIDTFKEDADLEGIEHLVVVGHGATERAMAMRLLRQPFEVFQQEKNPKNASVRLLNYENKAWHDKRYIFIPS